MKPNQEKQTVGKEEPEFKVDAISIVFLAIGIICSWVNMAIILSIQSSGFPPQVKINSYLSVIFTTIIPGVAIAYKNRIWGYAYMIGFALAGLPFAIFSDLFIGGYTFATALMIFIILWLIFWKAWRSLDAIKS